MPDPAFVSAARDIYSDSVSEMRRTLEGVTTAGLNWRPVAQDANSLAALAVHAMGATHNWLCIAFGATLPERDRASEFRAQAETADGLLALVDEFARRCDQLFDANPDLDGSILRATGGEGQSTAAWALFHAIEHLREHLGQLYLTRQLWEQSAGR
ncbi:MAG: DUF664 domain-containing protein [Dehalococcoidia bacterium]|nr:DUF664 domain-containing protein [Dehalococcoidia bacterium]